MLERFASDARQVVVRSEQEARELGHPVILAAHLLLALAWEGAGTAHRILTSAGLRRDAARTTLREDVGSRLHTLTDDDAEPLATIGIDLDEVRTTIEEAFGRGALDPQDTRRRARRPPFAPDAREALSRAAREAARLGDRHIGAEHLLLGVALVDRSSGALLRAHGIDPAGLRSSIAAEAAARHRPA